MKALILTEQPIYSKRTKIIMDKLVQAGYQVEYVDIENNDSIKGLSFDCVIVDEEIPQKEDFKKYFTNPLDSLW